MKTYRALFLFAGLGGGALGFLRARHPDAKFTVSGAVDFDPTAAARAGWADPKSPNYRPDLVQGRRGEDRKRWGNR